MGISSLQKNFVLVMECMPLTINDRACNYFACKQNNEYLPVVYNGISGAHRFCVENLCTSVFNDIGTITKPTAAVENAVVDKHAARHWLSTFLFASKVPLWTSGVHRHCRFVKEVPLCVCLTVSTRRPSNNIILCKK